MRSTQRQAEMTKLTLSPLNHFHLTEQAEERTHFELASEFGLLRHDVKYFKKKLNRS